MPREGLFRSEVEVASASRLGAPLRLPRIPGLVGPTTLLIAISVVAGCALLVRYPDRVVLEGALVSVPEPVRVRAPRDGRVTMIVVRQSERVTKGQLLAVLADSAAGGSIGTVNQLAIEAADAELKQVEREIVSLESTGQALRQAHARRVRSIESVIADVRAELALAEQRVALAEAEVRRTAGLVTGGFIASAGLEQRRDAALQARLAVATSDRELGNLRREMAAGDADFQSTLAQNERVLGDAQRRRAAAIARQAAAEAAKLASVVSPIDGVVNLSGLHEGSGVEAGRELLAIVPASASLVSRVTMTADQLPAFEARKSATVQYEAYPRAIYGLAEVDYGVPLVASLDRERGLPTFFAEAPAPVLVHRGVPLPLMPGMKSRTIIEGPQLSLAERILQKALSVNGHRATR